MHSFRACCVLFRSNGRQPRKAGRNVLEDGGEGKNEECKRKRITSHGHGSNSPNSPASSFRTPREGSSAFLWPASASFGISGNRCSKFSRSRKDHGVHETPTRMKAYLNPSERSRAADKRSPREATEFTGAIQFGRSQLPNLISRFFVRA